jgi:geranylgeranyl pyrophosphate synthase
MFFMPEDIIEFLKDKKPDIDKLLEKYLPRSLASKELENIFGKPRHAYDENALSGALSKPIWDFFDRGGKRIRPAMFLLVADALGGDIDKIKDFAAVVEFAHEGSIMIDDIEDLGELRRGKPCTHKIFGEDIAINAGNFMYFLPLSIFIRNKDRFDDKTMLKAWQVFGQEMINIHAGQAMDIFWHRGKQDEIGETEYMQMCAYKTGCLTRMAAKLAAVLSNASKEQLESLSKFAEMVGIGFQIQDDILSASGSEFQDKKGYGDDITEGKRTLIVIHALKNADGTDRKRLLEILNMHTKDKDLIKEALDILSKYGSIEYARNRANELVSNAWKEADSVLPESAAKQRLKALADFLIERKI